MRLAIVLSHPVQYYGPWFRWLASHTTLQLRVFYLSDAGVVARRDPRFGTEFRWDTDLLSGYDAEFVPNRSPAPHTDTFAGLANPGLFGRLERFRPEAVLLFGYRFLTHLGVVGWARLRGIPLVFRGDSHLLGRPEPTRAMRLSLCLLYQQFSAFACVGKANRDYFRALGVPASHCHFVPHAADHAHFRDPDGSHAGEAAALRSQLGLPPGLKVLLYAGKFHREKNPLGLLEAFATLAPRGWALVFSGDGPEAGALRARAAAQPGLPVRFLPFANQSAMPARYLLGDIFCLPSTGLHETWGLAVNEAMMMGRPCLVSNRVGCQQDLVLHGATGWVFDAVSQDSLVRVLAEALQAPLPELGLAARRQVANYSYAEASRGLLQALGFASPPAPRRQA